jgi:hypothetical protein
MRVIMANITYGKTHSNRCAMRVTMAISTCIKTRQSRCAMRVIVAISSCRKALHSRCAMRVIMAVSTCRKARHSRCAVRVIVANSTCRKACYSNCTMNIQLTKNSYQHTSICFPKSAMNQTVFIIHTLRYEMRHARTGKLDNYVMFRKHKFSFCRLNKVLVRVCFNDYRLVCNFVRISQAKAIFSW